VWLALGRAGLLGAKLQVEGKGAGAGVGSGVGAWSETMRMPAAVAGGVPWVQVA